MTKFACTRPGDPHLSVLHDMREMSLNTFFAGDIMIRTVTCAAKPPPKTYHEIKSTLKRDTLACGIGLSAFHLTLNGVAGGASSIVGTAASVAYVDMLGRYVDRIEDRPSQKQLLAPMSAAVFEVACNNTELLPFDFNYTETLICFLSYKIALFLMAYRSLNENEDD